MLNEQWLNDGVDRLKPQASKSQLVKDSRHSPEGAQGGVGGSLPGARSRLSLPCTTIYGGNEGSSPSYFDEVVSRDQAALSHISVGHPRMDRAPGGAEEGLQQGRGKWTPPSPFGPSPGLLWPPVGKLMGMGVPPRCQSLRRCLQPFSLTPFLGAGP